MTIQTGLGLDLLCKAEDSFGLAPAATGARRLRASAATLALARDLLASNELRSDAQLGGLRYGNRRVRGEIAGELSLAAWDDFFAAALRGDWVPGSTFTATLASAVTAAGRSFSRAAGSWLDDGFRVGDVVRWNGLSAGNDARNLVVVAVTAAAMTVADEVEAVAVGQDACTCAVAGRKLRTGTVRTSFAIEQHFAEAGFSQLFTGCRIGRMSFQLPAVGLATLRFAVAGRDCVLREGGAAPYFTPPAATAATLPLAGVDAVLRVGASEAAVVTGLDLVIDLDLATDPVTGAAVPPDVAYGRTRIGGRLTAFVDGTSLIAHFAEETEPSLHALLAAPGAEPRDFLALHLPRIRFSGADIAATLEHGLPVQLPFRAVAHDGGGGHDATAASLQVSS